MIFQKIILVSFVSIFVSCGGGDSGLVVSGKVQGLDGTLILQNNGKDDITIEKDGIFSFKVTDKTDYNVQMFREPCNQRCEIKNGKGTIESKNVENIDIICLAKMWSDNKNFLSGTAFENSYVHIFDIAMDKRGNIIVLWDSESNSLKNKLYKSEFRDGTWHHPNVDDYLGVLDSLIYKGSVAMNNNDQAVVVWSQRKNDGKYAVYNSEYRFGVWKSPLLVSDQINIADGDTIWTDVAMDDHDDIVMVWGNLNFSDKQGVYKAERRSGVWEFPIDENDKLNIGTDYAGLPIVAMSNNGESIILWQQTDQMDKYGIFKSEYIEGTWHSPKSPTDNLNSISKAFLGVNSLAMNNNGNILVGWTTSIADDKSRIIVSERDKGVWKESDYLNPDNGLVTQPFVSLADNGDAIIAWSEIGQIDVFNSSSFKSERRNGKWDWPVLKKDSLLAGENLSFPNADMDNYGNALITWTMEDSSSIDFLSKEYKLDHWTDIDFVGEDVNLNSQYFGTPIVEMNECRKIVIYPIQPATSNEIPKYFIRQYR